MSDYFVGEIRMFGFSWAPQTWALCDGSLLNTQQNIALYSLIGFSYGGSGTQFALPDLRGRVPVGQNAKSDRTVYSTGAKAGLETVTLTTSTMPAHAHTVAAVNNVPAGGPTSGPNTNFVATVQSAGHFLYAAPSNVTQLSPDTISNTGGGQPHNNMQPSIAVNYCIALQGVFPPRP